MDWNREFRTRNQIKLLDNEEAFVNEYIGFSELVVGNFSTIFWLFFSACLVAVLLFVAERLLLICLKKRIALSACESFLLSSCECRPMCNHFKRAPNGIWKKF